MSVLAEKTRHRVREMVRACLESQQPFLVDNTNARRSQRAEISVPAKAAGFRVIGYYFPCEGARPSAAISSVRKAGFRRRAWRPHTNALRYRSCPEVFDELFAVIAPDGDFSVLPWPADEVRRRLEARFHKLDWLS